MSDGFAELIDRSNAFFTELAANNSRDWFEPRKKMFVADIRKPAELLADILAEELSRICQSPLQPKLFRIYRDVRFSKDKSPYNPHLHMSFRAAGTGEAAQQWFFGSAPDYLVLCTGLPGLAGEDLARWRALIDREGDDLQAILETASQTYGARLSDYGPAPLKRVPKPYAPNHPHGDLLRRKGLVVEASPPADWRDAGLVRAIRDLANDLLPVWEFCRRL